ncbi:whi5 like domain protein [Emericellopsis cladophorae]|uniref:Whi5 like domain protein n=1 Tax=Emericellopsis cladophorae TaxID=2686198 RepID=A0A9P9Y5S5_9HYPO|nr:whi5 like domain protein [Emericellopsis cladophorae]KAI6783946.1 whi5 like domain protein [Emericellopsis cladophorae]
MDHQPAKRRVLGALNPNANLSPRPSPLSKSIFPSSTTASPVKAKSPLKRSIATVAGDSTPKRARVENDTTTGSRTGTPDESSLFDEEVTWVSSTTPGASPTRTLTREQARERAEILRLRLGLASYKVRTGQTNVPLEDLVQKPLPRDAVADEKTAQEVTKETDEQNEDKEEEQAVLPPLPEVLEDVVPVVGDEDARRRRLQGEAMNGLLSLARSGSDD